MEGTIRTENLLLKNYRKTPVIIIFNRALRHRKTVNNSTYTMPIKEAYNSCSINKTWISNNLDKASNNGQLGKVDKSLKGNRWGSNKAIWRKINWLRLTILFRLIITLETNKLGMPIKINQLWELWLKNLNKWLLQLMFIISIERLLEIQYMEYPF